MPDIENQKNNTGIIKSAGGDKRLCYGHFIIWSYKSKHLYCYLYVNDV